jgi:hypothetical protein
VGSLHQKHQAASGAKEFVVHDASISAAPTRVYQLHPAPILTRPLAALCRYGKLVVSASGLCYEPAMQPRYSWLWDCDLDNAGFEAALRGEGGRDAGWALARLIEYAPFTEIKRLLPRDRFLQRWPEISPHIRSQTRRAGMDFFHRWLQEQQAHRG